MKNNPSRFTTGSVWFIVILLLPHYQLPFFELFHSMDLIVDVLRFVSALTIILLALLEKASFVVGEKGTRLVLLFMLAYYAEIYVSTRVNCVDTHAILIRTVSQLTVFLICILYIRHFYDNLLRAGLIISEIIVYMNFISIVLYPQGLYKTTLYWNNWVLGYKNNFFQFYIGFMIVSYLYAYRFGKYIRCIVLNFVMFLSVIIVGSITAVVSMGLYYVMMMITKKDAGNKWNPFSLTLLNLMAFILMVGVRIGGFFSWLYNVMLHKGVSVNLRYTLWDRVLLLIKEKIFLGYGYRSNYETTVLLGARWATHAHNVVLQTLLEGGIVALFLYFVFNYLLLRELYDYRYHRVAQILYVAMFALYLSSLFEVYYRASTYILYGFACQAGFIIRNDMRIDGEHL